MADGLLSIDGSSVTELIDDIKASERRLGSEQRKAHRKTAAKVAGWAQSAARGGTRREAKYGGAIRAAATQTVARLRIASGGRNGGANPTFWGANRRSGWYGQDKYRGSTGTQHPTHIGSSWVAGKRGEGPYVLNDTIAGHMPDIETLYQDAHVEALSQAFGKD